MIYADYNGSAPLSEDVRDYLSQRLQEGPYANPNSIHHLGQKTLMGMENARSICAKILGTRPKNIIFNSGSTEGISQVFMTLAKKGKKEGKNIFIISGIEHSAVLKNALTYQEEDNFEVKVLPTFKNGIIDTETLGRWLSENQGKVALVAAMAANNETGVIQPYKDISKMCQEMGVPYLCDTTQIIGKAQFNFDESGADYAVMAGHKIGAMTGAGILLAKDRNSLLPMVIGGGQERGLRGGTQNYLGNETLAVALSSFQQNIDKLPELAKKREAFEKRIKEKFPQVVVIGEEAPRVASTTYLAYPGIHGQAVQIELESNDIYVTTSSACSDNEPTTSKVLKSMGVTEDIGRGVVRISFGLNTSSETFDEVATHLENAYTKLAKVSSF